MSSVGVSSNRSSKETTAFEIAKYSRARPPLPLPSLEPCHPSNRSTHSTCNPDTPPAAPSQIEWTHFTQPRLTLHVDVTHSDVEHSKKTETGLPRQTRRISLKMIWNSDPQSMDSSGLIPQTGLTFASSSVFVLEQIDLNKVVAEFSSSRLGEVPLKAVYKDCVVGLRYAVSHQAGSLIYNRFQVRFHTPTDCLDFVRVIEFICPCKPSPQDKEPERNRPSQTPFGAQADPLFLQSTLVHTNLFQEDDLVLKERDNKLDPSNSRLPVVRERETRPKAKRAKTSRTGLAPRKEEKELSVQTFDENLRALHPPDANATSRHPAKKPKQKSTVLAPKPPEKPPGVANEQKDTTRRIVVPDIPHSEQAGLVEDKTYECVGVETLIALPDAQLGRYVQEILREPNFLVLVERVQRMVSD
ncbi:hypothetical protein CROQUDRAFT_668206 [Cronartium quercuum f. sp. fusiforme G11]|uniref:Uncharacterized protein n=1 Tax=Cronartium quercuum f. sp. fusiforme G11 TaxID=708437 RepID=A0A9P6NVA8_9BASI|nr:hypothetical protein CROQUDRAFT_668206 [Cronartium quercuum f. sp. fusiforme G11]